LSRPQSEPKHHRAPHVPQARNADLILVMGRGMIRETGDHYALMEQKGLYYYLNSQQLEG
jgi:ABC-type multidrug transport system fused ATPase/permease subunit